MKVLILSSRENSKIALDIKLLCNTVGSETVIFDTANPCNGGFYSCLDKNDLVLIIWNKKLLEEYEVVFTVGYCLGSKKPFAMFKADTKGIPSCNGKAELLTTRDDLRAFITRELEKSEKKRTLKAAKSKLLEMGLEIDLRDFIESVSEGKSIAVEQFLKAGFSPDSCDKNGVSLLNIAVRKGHEQAALLLIDAGADIDVVSGDRGNTPVMDAAAEGNLSLLSRLVESGAELNTKSKSGQTALVLAIGRQAEEAALLLINYGADITIRDDLGMSANKYAELFKLQRVLSLIAKTTDDTTSKNL